MKFKLISLLVRNFGKSYATHSQGNLAYNSAIEPYTEVVVVYFILSRLLYLAFSVTLGLLCMPHPGMRPLV